jgi:hypothetical protein
MSGMHSDGDLLTKNEVWDLVNFIQSLSDSGAVKHNGTH